jgi:NTP pyrophosphatase (non-canonical NTP hydrolase)
MTYLNNEKTKRFKHLLLKLSEECCEVGQMAAKCSQFGFDSVRPNENISNRERLREELADVAAIVSMLNAEFNFNYAALDFGEHIADKIDRVNQYYKISNDSGFA